MEGEFDSMLDPARWGGGQADIKTALLAVADTMFLCRQWFKQYGEGIKPTAADLVAMTRLILEEEHAARCTNGTDHH